MAEQKTHFGYRSVASAEKASLVAGVFESVASKYDIMNDLMSVGMHRYWKHVVMNLSPVRAGQTVLDLAGGTGDLTVPLASRVGTEGEVILADINPAMLKMARKKLIDKGIVDPVRYVQANAEALPFADHYFDSITIAFGLRNVTDTLAALREMRRVLKPGGQTLILEFSRPVYAWFNKLYQLYSFKVIPRLGHYIAHDRASYQYLVESIQKHPDQARLLNLMHEAGFEDCDYRNLSGGIVAIHRGYHY